MRHIQRAAAGIAMLAMVAGMAGAALADPIVKSPEAIAMDAEPGCSTDLVAPLPQALSYYVDARVIGDTCETGVFLLILRDDDGAPEYTFAAPTRQMFAMEYAATRSEMADAIAEAVSTDGAGPWSRTSGLPEWAEGADAPGDGGEFPFYPEQWIDRDYYESMRNSGVPMYCHVQGIESMACLALHDERVEKIGIQTFPG